MMARPKVAVQEAAGALGTTVNATLRAERRLSEGHRAPLVEVPEVED
jgi:hypothetical protein